MKREHDKRSLLSGLGALEGWAAAIFLVLQFVEWTWQRKSTAWVGLTVLILIPVTFGVALVLGLFLMAIDCFPSSYDESDKFGFVVLGIGAVASVVISLLVTLGKSAVPRSPLMRRRVR